MSEVLGAARSAKGSERFCLSVISWKEIYRVECLSYLRAAVTVQLLLSRTQFSWCFCNLIVLLS